MLCISVFFNTKTVGFFNLLQIVLYRTWSNCNGFNKSSFALFVNGALLLLLLLMKSQSYARMTSQRQKTPSVGGTRCPGDAPTCAGGCLPLPFVLVLTLTLSTV